MLDRARGHVVSTRDPVTGGHHCAIGGGPFDFLVTSTLASQAPPAVGRALGVGLAHSLRVPSVFPRDSVSFVSVGDGSVNHSHYLSALNLADYTNFRGFKCPIVFAVSYGFLFFPTSSLSALLLVWRYANRLHLQ